MTNDRHHTTQNYADEREPTPVGGISTEIP